LVNIEMKILGRHNHTLLITLFVCIAVFTCGKATAQSTSKVQVTTWEIVGDSLANLLNNGWKPINVSVTDVATAPVPGIAGIRSQAFIYLLSKNGKYVTCILGNPDTRSANYSACRLIN
jgi:hypothetical protein